MAVQPVTPIILNNCVMKIAADDFAAACNGITFTPSGGVVNFHGMKPDAGFSFPTPINWTLDLSYAQDIETVTSLTNYLHEHEGETVAAVFEPVDGGASIEADIILTPGALGGAGGAVPTSTVKMGVNRKPEIVPAA